jgi:SNF2 family DNA or RNA helicase
MRDQMIAELDGGILTSTSPLTKMTRLLQFASAYAEVEYKDVYNEETRQVEHKAVVTLSDPSATLDAFMEDLPEYGEDSIVVFAVSKQLINLLSARLTKAGIYHGLITGDQDALERQAHMDHFQSGQTKIILCTIAAGGTGITLTKGRTAIFLQRSWSNIENTQAEGRVHRIGSQIHESVQIIDYVTSGTSQEVVFKAVEEKGRQLEFILRDKALMEKFLKNEEITSEDVDKLANPEEKEEESE